MAANPYFQAQVFQPSAHTNSIPDPLFFVAINRLLSQPRTAIAEPFSTLFRGHDPRPLRPVSIAAALPIQGAISNPTTASVLRRILRFTRGHGRREFTSP